MSDRYPGYDVLAKRDTTSWNAQTRQVIDSRLTISLEPRFFTLEEWPTLDAVCNRIMPQPTDRPPVPLPAYVDQKMADNIQDGYRYATLPSQGEAWRRAIAALNAEAASSYDAPFYSLSNERQDELLRRMQRGELTGPAWGNMPCKIFFEHRLIPDITHAYYAHPISWNEIGFGGPASPRGYVRMHLDRRDPWEAVEAKPGEEEQARRENKHVR